tara:strand:+ start:598 stop:750 length:153 start_codon:yes stop_codon:yes gene_type:complete
MKTINLNIKRIPGVLITLMLLYLTAAVSVFVLKVAFFLVAIFVTIKSFSR